MKKIVAALAFAAALVAGPAFADTMQNAYGNTITVTYPDGGVARYYFNADGTFTATSPGGTAMRGRWEAADGQICLLAPSGQRSCTELVAGKAVGDTWEQHGTDGAAITVALVAGRADFHADPP